MRGHFQRQAVHREKTMAFLVRGEFLLIAQPCLYCASREKPGVGIMRNGKGYMRVNPFSCSGRCNMANRDMGLSEFLSGPVTLTLWQERHGHLWHPKGEAASSPLWK